MLHLSNEPESSKMDGYTSCGIEVSGNIVINMKHKTLLKNLFEPRAEQVCDSSGCLALSSISHTFCSPAVKFFFKINVFIFRVL